MPSEAQLKAQMQAAIAKKKQEAVAKDTKEEEKPAATVEKEKAAETTSQDKPAETKKSPTKEEKVEPKSDRVVLQSADTPNAPIDNMADDASYNPSPDPNAPQRASDPDYDPHKITFYGISTRFTILDKKVYFAITDLLPLSKDPDWNNKFIEFLNNPKTKNEAEKLTKILTFKDNSGSDKTHGATGMDLLTIFRDLKFTPPGPFGRWLIETTKEKLKSKTE
jgi:hypothetical protein